MTKSMRNSAVAGSAWLSDTAQTTLSERQSRRASTGSAAAVDPTSSMSTETKSDDNHRRPPSLLKHILSKDPSKKALVDGAPKVKEGLEHDGNNASIVMDEVIAPETPWTPRSLVRAKSAIIYKHTLNDSLQILERNIFFFSGWVTYFVSLQEDCVLLFNSRENWEQGLTPDKIIDLKPTMMLSEMKVEIVTGDGSSDGENFRLFRRKLLETDEIDQWLNDELRQSLVISSGSAVDGVLLNNPEASARCVLEFASHSQNTFELWSKTIRRILQVKRDRLAMSTSTSASSEDTSGESNNAPSPLRPSRVPASKSWVSPGHDSKLTLHQSEIWCHRVLSGDKEKAESEMRRIIAMEKLVLQVTNPRMALLVYEKVSRVHELFIANSRREIEGIDGREKPLSSEVLNFFADHLKRKYSVFLILALAYGVGEEEIREAHEAMCEENAAVNAGVGGGVAELQRNAIHYGFEDEESVELYEKYRDAAANYHRMNYGDSSSAEEEDAIMHLPVMLQVSIVRHDQEESRAMMKILEAVKARLLEYCTESSSNNDE